VDSTLHQASVRGSYTSRVFREISACKEGRGRGAERRSLRSVSGDRLWWLWRSFFTRCVDKGPGFGFRPPTGVEDPARRRPKRQLRARSGETDFKSAPTATHDGVCDGIPKSPAHDCTGCEDCTNNGFFEPCLVRRSPLTTTRTTNGIPPGQQPILRRSNPSRSIASAGRPVALRTGASRTAKPFPVRPTQRRARAVPDVDAGPSPTFVIPVATATPGYASDLRSDIGRMLANQRCAWSEVLRPATRSCIGSRPVGIVGAKTRSGSRRRGHLRKRADAHRVDEIDSARLTTLRRVMARLQRDAAGRDRRAEHLLHRCPASADFETST